jgi:anti-sigma B factor antagonist
MEFGFSVNSSPAEIRIRPRGEIDMAVADGLGEAIISALKDGSPRVVVDLTEVTFLDSSGIRALLMARKVADEHDRSLVVENPAPMVHRVLTIGGVLGLLTEGM